MSLIDTILDESVLTIPYEDPDDGSSHMTHIVNPPMNTHIWQPGMTSQELVEIARMTGQEVTSLCGYTWVPKRNPDKYPACDLCVEIAGDLMRSNNE